MGMFLGAWAAMVGVAMVPATAPATRLVAGTRGRLAALGFLGAYSAAWLAFGAVGYLLLSPLAHWVRWLGAGTALALTAVYELSPAKDACLRRCRTPARILLQPALRGGLRHAVDCGGCCAFLMALMVALGLMGLWWSLLLGAVVLVQKAAPLGERSTWLLGGGMLSAAVIAWI